MPKRPPIVTATDLANMRFQINEALREISDYVEEICGIDQKQFKSQNDINFNNYRALNVGTPTTSTDAANKAYIDSLVADSVDGPASSTDNAVARFDGAGGNTIQNSLATVSDAGTFNIPSGQTYNVGGSAHSHTFDGLSDVVTTSEEQGDLPYRNATGWVNLHHGTSGQALTSGGHGANPSWTTPGLLASVSGIDAKTIATTTLYTVPTGLTLVIDSAFIRCTTLTGAKSTNAKASVGSNSTDYDDYLTATDAVFTTSSKVLRYTVNSLATEYPICAAGTTVKLNITVGSDAATAETWAVDLFGYLITTA